jgi:hypothetical protein
LKDDKTPDVDASIALAQLKSKLEELLGESQIIRSMCQWAIDQDNNPTGDITAFHLDDFCREILDRFKRIIIEQISAYWGCDLSADDATMAQVRGSQQELDLECADHLRFAGERAPEQTFVGRKPERQRIRDYVHSETNQPFVVHGPSGSGKTALLGKIIQEVTPPRSADGTRAKTRPIVLARFIGTTPESSNLRSLLSSLCRELRQDFEVTAPLPTDLNKLIDEFYAQLGKATAARPVFIFLDALDQLDAADNGRSVHWLRSPLSSTMEATCHARMVASCLSPSDEFPEDSDACEPFRELKLRTLLGNHELGALDENDARQLFARWLHGAGRSVSETQGDMIWSAMQQSSACRQPLFLKVLFEEAKLWRSYDADVRLNEPETSNDYVGALLTQLFDRLSLEVNHGKLLVERALGYITAARRGLSETEILEVLFADPEYWTELDKSSSDKNHTLPTEPPRIPIAIWSRLRSDLGPYLTERAAPGGNVLTLYHRQVAEWIKARFVDESDWNPHDRLATFFRRRADPNNGGRWKMDVRALAEMPYHLASSGREVELQELFSSLSYLATRVATGQVHEQVADYVLAGSPLSPALAQWQEFLQKHTQRLTQHPAMLVALVNHEGFPTAHAQAASIAWPSPWLRTSRELMPECMTPVESGLRTEILGSLDFPRGSAMALATKVGLVFRADRLGVVRVFDAHAMRQLDIVITIRRERPLVLVCVPDATGFVVFYESGEAELYHCGLDLDERPVSSKLVAKFEYHLPQFEDPVPVWHAGAYWFQSRPNSLAWVSAEDGHITEEDLPTGVTGEISALLFAEGSRFIAVRQNNDVLLLASGTPPLKRTGTDVVAACNCDSQRVSVAFTDGTIVVYDLSAGLVPQSELRLSVLRGASGWDGQRLLWLADSNVFSAWQPGESKALPVHDNQEVFPVHLHVLPRCWVREADGAILLLTSHNVIRFHLHDGGTARAGRIEEIFGGPIWRAVQKRGDDQWLLERKPSREVLLGRGVMGRLYCAPDGRGRFFSASGYGPGLVFDLVTLQSIPLQGCPTGLNVAAGDAEGGCWFTDRVGDIFFGDGDGSCECVARINLRNVNGAQLYSCGRHLVWYGYSDQYFADTGADPARTFVFFRKNEEGARQLQRLGEKILHPREGVCTAICYDSAADRLVTAWTKEGRGGYTLRLGSVEHFLDWRVEERDMIGLGVYRFVQAELSADGCWLGVVNVAGEFCCVSVKDGNVSATLAASSPFTAVAPGSNHAEFWLVESRTAIYLCTLVAPS